ncbi:MAG: hypothetical protein HQM08_07020 [Candidatus Riflebacteria bacterium]|nr:hypothetical protein [Candidatus Riflebacteria bacterium]
MSNKKIPLNELKKALEQPNSAIKKRALAVIFNESIIEAKSILEDYLGRETEPELQALGLKVLKKLQSFSKYSGEVGLERLEPFLSHNDPERRLLGLRGLIGRRSSQIPFLIHKYFSQETNSEALLLISEILKQNPDFRNYPMLLNFANSPTVSVKISALDSFLGLIAGLIIPNILNSLDDPSPPVKMKAFQIVSKIERKWIFEALDSMLSSDLPEISRKAGNLLHLFICEELLPVISRHSQHPDSETSELCRHALFLLSKRGCTEAEVILDKFEKSEKVESKLVTMEEISPGLHAQVKGFPFILGGILRAEILHNDSSLILYRLKECFGKICTLLASSFIAFYFAYGQKKKPELQKKCFKALSEGILKFDIIDLLESLSHSFPPPDHEGDLFPAILAKNILEDYEENLFGEIISLREGFSFLAQHPEMAETLLHPALVGMEKLFSYLQCFKENSLIVKSTMKEQIRFINFWKPSPEFVDPRQLANFGFEIKINAPVLVSKNSCHFLEMHPYLAFDNEKMLAIRSEPDEQELWDFLTRNNILEAFLAFLTERV